jgi:ABC-type multidrug transport system ATPase subunit
VTLALEGVGVTYAGGREALAGVTLTIPPGIFGLLGPNGAGKSTLLRVIATLQEPTTGRVTLDGADVHAHPAALRARLGYLPQDFGLYPTLTAQATLDHFAALKGLDDAAERRARVAATLERVNLAGAARQAVGTFSGGMRQSLGLAIALVGTPRLLLLDEPTAGLDPAERHRLYDLLAGLAGDAIIVLSTHLVEDVAALAPALAILDGGRLVRAGEARALVAALAGRTWRVDAAHAGALAPGARILARRSLAGQPQLRVRHDAPPHASAVAVEPTLEDAWFDAVGRDPSA